MASLDTFERKIKEAYTQLQCSYEMYKQKSTDDVSYIKIILLYDEFSNISMIEKSIPEIFDNDPKCFIMTIENFEVLLYLNRFKHENCQKILQSLIDIQSPKERKIYLQFTIL